MRKREQWIPTPEERALGRFLVTLPADSNLRHAQKILQFLKELGWTPPKEAG